MEERLKYALTRVSEKINDFINDKEIDKNADFYQGMSLAYRIVTETIQNSLPDEFDLIELGMNIDADKVL